MKYRVAIVLFLVSIRSSFALMPVLDSAALIQLMSQLKQLKEQYSVLQNTYLNAKSQLESIKRLKEYNSGHYGFGTLENGLNDLRSLQSSANDWNDALKNIAGGNKARYEQLVKAYEQNSYLLDDKDYAKAASPERAKRYSHAKAVNKTVSVQTTYAFNEINQHLQKIHDLSNKIEQASNTKSAVDLNSRLTTELAYILVMNLKLQTLISQQLAQNSANELAEDSEMAKFYTLPNERQL